MAEAEIIVPLDDRPEQCRVLAEATGDGVRLRRWTGHPGVAAFMTVWLAGWTLGCVLLINQAINAPTPLTIFLAIPFVGAWFFGLAVLLRAVFSEEELIVTCDQLIHRSGLRGRNVRRVPKAEVRGTAIEFVPSPTEDMTYPVLRIGTAGRPIDFGRRVSFPELQWLQNYVNDWFVHFGHAIEYGREPQSAESLAASRTWQVIESSPNAERPSDSRFVIEREHETLCVRKQRLRLRDWLGAVGITVFLNAFWNGIVGIFAMKLLDDFAMARFIFLLPFMIIGCALVGTLLIVLLQPWIVSLREITVDSLQIEVVRRLRVLGMSFRISGRRSVGKWTIQCRRHARNDEHQLRIEDADGVITQWNFLSQGEARWLITEITAQSTALA